MLRQPVQLTISGTEGHACVVNGQLFFNSKHVAGADGKKPKPYTYVVVSQKAAGHTLKYTRMEFDNTGRFTGLLAQPLDPRDIQ